jgi:hypothetical protein
MLGAQTKRRGPEEPRRSLLGTGQDYCCTPFVVVSVVVVWAVGAAGAT